MTPLALAWSLLERFRVRSPAVSRMELFGDLEASTSGRPVLLPSEVEVRACTKAAALAVCLQFARYGAVT